MDNNYEIKVDINKYNSFSKVIKYIFDIIGIKDLYSFDLFGDDITDIENYEGQPVLIKFDKYSYGYYFFICGIKNYFDNIKIMSYYFVNANENNDIELDINELLYEQSIKFVDEFIVYLYKDKY